MVVNDKTDGRTEYRLRLDRDVVLRLRERAARQSRLSQTNISWVALVREALAKAAAEGGAK